MISIDVFDQHPLQPGDKRELVLSGDGPFTVTNSCFIDAPPPPGFRPCSACGSVVVPAGKSHFVIAEKRFWSGKEGTMEITISDAVGGSVTIRLAVKPDSNNAPTIMTAGA